MGQDCQWWAEEKVSSLELSAPFSVQPSVTVEQAVEIMVKEGFDQLPVLTAKGKIHSTDPVEAAVYTQFKKLSLDTTLSKVNRILDTDHFALVVHTQRIYTSHLAVEEQEVIVGIVTDIDLLQYISKAEQGNSSGTPSPPRGDK